MSEPERIAARRVRIWDAPTRLFHWLLVLLIALLYASGEFDLLDMRWHFWAGYATLALIGFRVLWGVFGSQTSRFAEFVRGPSAAVAYARAWLSGQHGAGIGHNPLGGWSVLALLLCVLVQAVSGLFASDDIDNDGPLAAHVTTRTVRLMTRIHHWNENVLLVLIGVHVAAVLLYLVVRRDNLITPMISGRRFVIEPPTLRFASAWRALALLLLSAAAVAALVWWAGA
jgi:cytochrome b